MCPVSRIGRDTRQNMNLKGRKIFRCVGLMSLLAGAIFLTACSGADSKASAARPSTPPAVPVAIAPARRTDLPVYLTGLGSVTPYNSVSIKSRVDGQLTQVVRAMDIRARRPILPTPVPVTEIRSLVFRRSPFGELVAWARVRDRACEMSFGSTQKFSSPPHWRVE